MDDTRLLTVKEAAYKLRVSPLTIRRRISAGELEALQLGGPGKPLRIAPGALEALLQPVSKGQP
jgi:excisionase family DNA binding protein